MTDPAQDSPMQSALSRLGRQLGESELPLHRLELRIVELPLVESFQSAIGSRQVRQALLIRWWGSQDSWGIAECACRPDPYYSPEFLTAAMLTVEEHIAPRLGPRMTLANLVEVLSRIRGWQFTRGAVFDSALDYLRRQGQAGLLETWRESRRNRVRVGISLGIFPRAGLLIDRIAVAAAQGYQRIKLKIQPGMPADYLEEVRREFPGIPLALDANGSFDLASMEELQCLARFQPLMLEQPFPPDRLDLTRELKKRCPQLQICLDESIHGRGELGTALLLEAIDELNLKPGRVGGELSSILLADLAEGHSIPVWVGGMFETGIGRSANLRLAAYLQGETVHDLSPSSRYFDEDLVELPIRMDGAGTIPVPEAPPVLKEDVIDRLTKRTVRIRVEP